MRYHLLTCLGLTLLIAVACVADERHPLTKALDYDTNLLLVADLRLTDGQLTDLQQAAQTAGAAVVNHDKAREAALKDKAQLLEGEFSALAEGRELTVEQAAALGALRDAQAQRRERMYGLVDAQIRRLKRSLNPDQAALVNWNRPSDVPAATDQTAALEELRLLSSRLERAESFIRRIRYLIGVEFIQTHVAQTEEYLRQYVRPNTPEFADAREWVLKLLGEARTVNEKDWPQQAPLFASQLLQRLGLLDKPNQGGAQAQTRYGWWDVYYLLTDAQTPGMLQAFANGAPAADDDQGAKPQAAPAKADDAKADDNGAGVAGGNQ